MKKIVTAEVVVGDQVLVLETGRLAGLADAAVTARLGETEVLATVTSSAIDSDLDYLPLSVDYIERYYAGGRIKGSRWVKREGRPSDEAILTARLIDRSIRPLFPKGYRRQVDVVITVLSVDLENNPDILGLLAASAALAITKLPWQGPVGGLRVGLKVDSKSDYLINATYSQSEGSKLDLIISGTDESIVMLEGFGLQVPEEQLTAALDVAHLSIKKMIEGIVAFAKQVGVKKETFTYPEVDQKLVSQMKKKYGKEIIEAVGVTFTHRNDGVGLFEVKKAILEEWDEAESAGADDAFEYIVKCLVRDSVFKEGKRIDGRKVDEIRELAVEVGVLPRTHGSAIFDRGKTQALSVTTLGSMSLGQLIEDMEGEKEKRYMHHYYMPPYSTGETGRLRSPGRREIGHGILAERALMPVLPTKDEFPYAMRVVSEIMSCNGSTSMASVCGSTLSLMDAGVPIAAPVAGIAMGLMTDGEKEVILTDILGAEDFNGDMDFKVAGTRDGVTAVQMDVKNTHISLQTLKEVIVAAKKGRLFILDKMSEVLAEPRAEINAHAPKIELVQIPVEKIGEVIGPGGRVIRQITADTGAEINVDDEGRVSISSPDKEAM
ncbi:polyribonucleotide nucleotidyltransferase, partial [Patescibacteria group bacterium]|nr:polyribonucleotide nucleotidyltransferase [Patescibacteria group bacterium]